MAINLKKNEGISLNKEIRAIRIGLGWDADTTGHRDFDLDASAFLLNAAGRTRNEQDLVFYGALDHISDSVHHMGDNLVGGTGSGRDDDEQITVDLTKVPPTITRIIFTVTIYDWDVRRQNFGMVKNAYIRVIDETDPDRKRELVRYDLTEDFSTETAVIAASIDREGSGWKFVALGESFNGGLRALCGKFGVNVL